MARLRKPARAPSTGPTSTSPSPVPSGPTPADFEKELKSLKHKAETHSPFFSALSVTTPLLHSSVLIVLAALFSSASLHALSPSFGGIPSAIHHSQVTGLASFVGWAGAEFLYHKVWRNDIARLIPVVASWAVVGQFYLAGVVAPLGGEWAPVAMLVGTVFPVVMLTASAVARVVDGRSVRWLPSWLGDSMPGLLTFALFKLSEAFFVSQIPGVVGANVLYSRVGIQILACTSLAALAPSKLLLLTIPALLHTVFLNTHLPTPWAFNALQKGYLENGFKLIDRRESLTGYISVFENTVAGFRALRCDHSLLGGEWVNHAKGAVAEPIYSVFVLLEAVRLVVTKTPIVDKEAKALVIGLGIGTTPGAFVAHGIDTTIVEIDPVVHEFATTYFDLPASVKPVLTDAVSYTASAAKSTPETYDYIIHDVFTGGAEPVPLFTHEFLTSLSDLLKPNGVIAINYAGDFLLPPSKAVFKTVKSIFPTCRVFRESERMTAEQIAEQNQDFSNIVIFCRKTTEPISFRTPVPADTLNTHTRRLVFPPRFEVRDEDYKVERDVGIVRVNETQELESYRESSSVGHWTIMRDVIDPYVWMNW